MKKILFSIFIFCLIFAIPVFADYPNYQGYVNDFAHVLSNQFIQSLDNKLAAFDKKTTNQIAVVTVKTTQPETIENYSIHLADKWKPGQKGKDNGIIMLFALQDRQMRIDVGRGLEGNLTDIQAKHIETDIIRPEFRAGNYESGIDKGVNAAITILDPTYTATPVSFSTSQSSTISGTLILIIGIAVIVFIIFLIAYSPFTPLGGSGIWGIPVIWGDGRSGGDNEGSGFGGFGGGGFSGGGASSNW